MNPTRLIAFGLFFTFVLTTWASTPRDVDDLVDMRVSKGEDKLEDRGYHHRKTVELKNGDIAYWWNSRHDQCIAINIKDGRFIAINEQPESMCDKDNSSHHGSRSSSHGSDNLHDLVDMRASSGERELEDMGYHHRKTLEMSHGDIDYWWNSRKDHCIAVNVKDGRFTAVTDQPESMCDKDSGSSGSHHRSVDDVKDVVDMRERDGSRELKDMGYHHRKTLDVGKGSIDYWWNSRKDHCIAVNVKDGHYTAVTDQPESMCD